MTAAGAALPRARAGGLALAVGLHAGLIGLLLAHSGRQQPVPAGPARAFLLVPLRPPAPAPATPVPPAHAARPVARPPTPRERTPAPAPPSVLMPAPAAMADTAEPAPDPFAPPVQPMQPEPSLAERARASAGKLARELASAPARGVLAGRRDKDFGQAFRGGSNGFTVDRYVSPDGTSVTRQTGRGRVACYMPTPYQLRVIPRSSDSQREVNCPPDSEAWERR